MADFNAKIGQQQIREYAVGKFGLGSRNNRGDMLVSFAERNNLRIMNTFFRNRQNRKRTWKGPNSETKKEIDFILTGTLRMIHYVQVIGRIKTSYHRMARSARFKEGKVKGAKTEDAQPALRGVRSERIPIVT